MANCKYEECPICNEEIDDEKYADGLWDLAGNLCEAINDYVEYRFQDTIYYALQAWMESRNYCPNCGRNLKENNNE